MERKTLDIEGVGPVVFVKNKQASRLKLMVMPGREVRVSMPRSYSLRQAQRFVQSQKEWIQQSLAKMEEKYEDKNRQLFEDGQQISPARKLKISPCMGSDFRFAHNESELIVSVPFGMSSEDADAQEAIRWAVGKILVVEAKIILPPRLIEIAEQTGLSNYGRVTVRNNVSRWGSCSSSNNISLSAKLICLPGHLRDYVILHELAHTIEKNHGPRFWALVDEHSPYNVLEARRELRAYSLRSNIVPQ